MNINKEARQILNLQANKDTFLSEAIVAYSNSRLPVDERVTLQQKEIARLRQSHAANESYIIELEETIDQLRGQLAQMTTAPSLQPLQLTVTPESVQKWSDAEKRAIRTDAQIQQLKSQLKANAETIKGLRARLNAAVTQLLKVNTPEPLGEDKPLR